MKNRDLKIYMISTQYNMTLSKVLRVDMIGYDILEVKTESGFYLINMKEVRYVEGVCE